MSEKKISDSSIARMAGNIASGYLMDGPERATDEKLRVIAEVSVRLARFIAAEVERS